MNVTGLAWRLTPQGGQSRQTNHPERAPLPGLGRLQADGLVCPRLVARFAVADPGHGSQPPAVAGTKVAE